MKFSHFESVSCKKGNHMQIDLADDKGKELEAELGVRYVCTDAHGGPASGITGLQFRERACLYADTPQIVYTSRTFTNRRTCTSDTQRKPQCGYCAAHCHEAPSVRRVHAYHGVSAYRHARSR